MSCGIKPIQNPNTNSIPVCAFKCNRDVAMAPAINENKANEPLMFLLK